MRYLLLFLLSAFLYPLSVLSQASGGEITRKRTSPVVKQEKRVTQKNATASQIPTIMVVDEVLKTCELHSYEDSPCIKRSTSGEFVVPEVIDGYTVTQIGEGAFFFCTRLNYIKLPPTIKVIKSNAFCRCDWLKSIEIPQGVTEIGRDAFMNCYSLSKVICNSLTPPALEENAFSSISNSAILYVPVSTKTAYEKTKWNSFFSKIIEKEM